MTRVRWLLPCAAALSVACAVAPHGGGIDPAATVNAVRARGCGGHPGAPPLRSDTRLDAVAARLSGGGTLADVVAAERYPAAKSRSLQFVRPADDRAVAQQLET